LFKWEKYWFEPFSKSILSKEAPELIYIPAFANRTSELVIKFSYRKELKYLYTSNIGDERLEAIFPGKNGNPFFFEN